MRHPHPGEVLIDLLSQHHLSQATVAEHLGISATRLNELIRGKRGVTPETAVLLSQALETSPEYWMGLQATWDLQAYAEEFEVRKIKPLI